MLDQNDNSQHLADEALWVETSKTLPQGAQKGALEGYFGRTWHAIHRIYMDLYGFIKEMRN